MPRNVTEYSHGEEGLIIEEWMRQRGFVSNRGTVGRLERSGFLAPCVGRVYA
jgi:hypothetical protein